jgi:hypothetical protein
LSGCPAELPDNVHIPVDFLRRILRMNPTRIVRVLYGVRSLGFRSVLRNEHGDSKRDPNIMLEWHDMSVAHSGNFTFIANAMIGVAVSNYCREHGTEMLERLDFGQLATASKTKDDH